MTQENPENPPEPYQRSEFGRDARRLHVVLDDGTVKAVGVALPSGRAVVEEVGESVIFSERLSVYSPEEGVEDLRDDLENAEVRFLDISRHFREGYAVECPKCEGEVILDEWNVYREGGGSCPLCGYEALPERVRLSRDDEGDP